MRIVGVVRFQIKAKETLTLECEVGLNVKVWPRMQWSISYYRNLTHILEAECTGNHDLSLIFRDILDGVMELSHVVSDFYFYVILLIFMFIYAIISSLFQLINLDLASQNP